MDSTTTQHVESKPGVCGGKPCITGTRIRVWDVYVWHQLQGQSPDEIVARFPQLSLGDVHAALAYYFDHREEIHDVMKREEDLVARLRADQGPGLLERLRAQDSRGDSLSP